MPAYKCRHVRATIDQDAESELGILTAALAVNLTTGYIMPLVCLSLKIAAHDIHQCRFNVV